MAPVLKVYLNKKGEFLSGEIIANTQSRTDGPTPDSLNRAVSRIKILTAMDFERPGLKITDEGRIVKD